ncbi:hypothetical protein XPA_000050 [Xanthoria parietina]
MIYMSIHPSINPQIYIPIPQTVKAKNAPPPPHQNPHSPPHLLHHALPIPQQRYYPRSSQRSERTYQSACEWDTDSRYPLPRMPAPRDRDVGSARWGVSDLWDAVFGLMSYVWRCCWGGGGRGVKGGKWGSNVEG